MWSLSEDVRKSGYCDGKTSCMCEDDVVDSAVV